MSRPGREGERAVSRRDFFASAMIGASAMVAARSAGAQQPGGRGMLHDSSMVKDSTNLFAMDQSAARQVSLPPKPNAAPLLTDLQRDELEHKIHCQCGCTLDVFTCRTTDFSCQVSPAMHRDVVALVQGGYSAQEIIDAFVNVYGDRVLMAPRKSGFDLLAWVTPGISVLVVGGLLAVLLRRWRAAPVERPIAPVGGVDATPDELARLEAAIRRDDE
jgi:cytochrome c-type biogenesis protein CcmH